MTLDRRELLAGVAATTAAASVPTLAWSAEQALLAHGASFRGRRFYFPQGFFFSLAVPWSHAAYVAHYESRWHFDPNPKGRALIKHEGSGLTFRQTPQPDDPFVMEAVFIDDPLDGWPDAESMAAVGRASVWTFVHGANLRYMERRRGAIYFRWRERNPTGGYMPLDVEDAPALS